MLHETPQKIQLFKYFVFAFLLLSLRQVKKNSNTSYLKVIFYKSHFSLIKSFELKISSW